MREHLFLYGTLLPALAPPELRPALARLRSLGRGVLRGILYDLGDHPGAVPDAQAATRIAGEVFELPDDPALLAQLDAYEGYVPERPSESLFVRVRQPVSAAGIGRLECWVYVYARDPAGAPRVVSGDWIAHARAKAASRARQP